MLLVLGPVVWFLAPSGWALAVTPWIDTVALLVAGLYLGRVVNATATACCRHVGAGMTGAGEGVRGLCHGLPGALAVVACTLVLAVVFLFAGLRVLAETASMEVAALFWALCLGGLFLSLFVGEPVMRLVDVVDG